MKRKRKKRCFTRNVHGAAGVSCSWELDSGQVSRFFSQATAGEWVLGSVTMDSVTLDSVTLLRRSRSSCASSSFALSLEPGNS